MAKSFTVQMISTTKKTIRTTETVSNGNPPTKNTSLVSLPTSPATPLCTHTLLQTLFKAPVEMSYLTPLIQAALLISTETLMTSKDQFIKHIGPPSNLNKSSRSQPSIPTEDRTPVSTISTSSRSEWWPPKLNPFNETKSFLAKNPCSPKSTTKWNQSNLSNLK